MKTLLFCCCLFTVPSIAQTVANDPAAAASSNLKDDFAKSGLRVLKMIEGETGESNIGSDGSLLVPRSTSQAIDNLDVDAQTKDDLEVVRVLQVFFRAKINHNVDIHILSMMASNALLAADLPRGPLQVSDLVAKSPTIVKIHSNEVACSSELEAALRARKYREIAACSEEALAVVTPKTLDVPLQPNSAMQVAHQAIVTEVTRELATNPRLIDQMKANNIGSATSPSAAASKSWDIASAGHVLTEQELSQMMQNGQASLCLIVTTPAGAEIDIDGKSAGKSPQGTTLVRHADVARVITIKMEGYETVEKSFAPDGKDIVLNVKLKEKHP
jgi:hypothetical protein